MSAGAQMDPHGKMRSRDVGRVARGEQAPRPPHEYGTVSKAPAPASVHPPPNINQNNVTRAEKEETPADQPRHCYASYIEYQRCVRDKGKDASSCNKLASHYKALCPNEWVKKWDEQRENGTFHPI